MKPQVLITGGSGLIGSHLSRQLLSQNYDVIWLTRRNIEVSGIETIQWDPASGTLAKNLPDKPTIVINLAGENLSKKRWTQRQKDLILTSRTNSLHALYRLVENNPNQFIRFISTSAIGYYGTFSDDQILDEESPAGNDFLADTCVSWERAIQAFTKYSMPLTWIRTGVVLSRHGGVLKVMSDAMPMGLTTHLGRGNQWVPWIHVEDLCNIFIHLINNPSLTGPFNAVAPEGVRNKALVKAWAKQLGKRYVKVGIPGFILRLGLGEMASLSLKGTRISSNKIQQTGFRFNFPELDPALLSF